MSVYDSLFLLDGLEQNEKCEIISAFPKAVAFAKGEIIYSSQKFSHALGLVISGTAVAVTNNAHKVVMNKFTCGMCFGAAAVFGNNNEYVSSIIADTDSEILFITESALTEIFKAYPKTAINYIAFLSDKIRFLNHKLSVISCISAEDTVFKYLSSTADSDDYALLPKSMTELSRMLGIGRASLYRSLDSLEATGCIKRENNKIKVINNEKTN